MAPQKKLSMEDMIDEQLGLQIEISYKRHREFMLMYGLGECRTVVDLGTANGLFLHTLATDHPNITFHGIDSNEMRISQAKQYGNINVEWLVGNINDPEFLFPLLNKADGVLMRYFLLHLTNVDDLLGNLAQTLKKNASLWIFDLDLDNLKCEPPHDALENIRHIVQSFFDTHSLESPAGKNLRTLLEKNRFTNIQMKEEPYSNQNIHINSFKKFILNELRLYNWDLYGTPESDKIRDVEKFLDEEEIKTGKRVLNYGMSMVGAKLG